MNVIKERTIWDDLGDIGGAIGSVIARNRMNRGYAKDMNGMLADMHTQALQDRTNKLGAYGAYLNEGADEAARSKALAELRATGFTGDVTPENYQGLLEQSRNAAAFAGDYRNAMKGKRWGNGFIGFNEYMNNNNMGGFLRGNW